MLNRLPRVLLLFAAVVVLAGCSQNLGPKTYTAEVKTNYMSTCVDGSDEKLGGEAGAKTYCECTFAAVSAPAPAGIPFDRFKNFESYLRDHVGDDVNNVGDLDATYGDILDLFEGCVSQGPIPAGATTTIPATTTAR